LQKGITKVSGNQRTYYTSLPTTDEKITFPERIWKKDKDLRDHYSQEYWDAFIGGIESLIDELAAGL
jgi:hypothetical protein